VPYLSEMDGDTGYVSIDTREKGQELSETYNSARPFPHIVIDDFLPREILDLCLEKFPSNLSADDEYFEREQERYKAQFNPDALVDPLRRLFYSFNSKPFIRVLENITGIKGLIPDPYFLGAGFHEIGQGGHLSVHVDFNHHKPMNLERRINLLIYLNKDWEKEYGGQLELWNIDMSKCEQSVVPIFNRCVIFSTSSGSYHGNPHAVAHPDGVTRKSIALYYYTSTWSDAKRDQTTQFKVRPGTADRVDTTVRNRELVTDLLPPILLRNARRLKQRLRG
jgi:hypothetical protein